MKRWAILLMLFFSLLDAVDLHDIYSLYRNHEYKEACNRGYQIFHRYKEKGDFLMLYAFACLKADYIDRLAVPIISLRKTKSERANASYFATILLQKKLLYHALIDHMDISHLQLPKTDYILSKVFDLFVNKRYQLNKKGQYVLSKNGDKIFYILYAVPGKRFPKMIIEERTTNQLIKTHRYW